MNKCFISFLLIFLISCGGGGGGSNSSPTNPQTNQSESTSQGTSSSSTTSTTTTTSSYNPNLPTSGAITLTGNFEADKSTYESSPEYIDQYGLSMINASSAYARGATGRGAIIGIMDSGVDTSHQELNSFNKLLPGSYLVYQDRSPSTDEKRHGSHVSGIALGERDGSGIHGVAFDAQLFFISIELGTAGDTYEPATIDSSVDYSGIDSSWSQLEAEFVAKNVTVVNGSFGYQGNINDYTEENIRQAFPKTIDVLAQSQKPDEDKTIFVWAAGNGGSYSDQGVDFSSPEVFGGLAYLLPELRGNTAAVVSVDEDGGISSFSNRCGVAKDYCLAAPGRSILSIYAQDAPVTDSYGRASGTSMAAPHVSGGIALLADYFEGQLGNTEILQRLFVTANKSGIYSDSEIYGQGLMDLNAATQPVGTAMIASIGSTLSNLTLKEEGSYLGILGPAFGNSISGKLSQLSYVVFDELGAPFKRSIGDRLLNNIPNIEWITAFQLNPQRSVSEHVISMSNGVTFNLGVNDDFVDVSNNRLWADTETRLAYFSFEQNFTNNSKLFFGNGTSPNTYMSSKKGFNHKGTPFLDYASDGSFVGIDINLPNQKDLLLSFFQGSHQDNKRFVNTLDKNEGFIIELSDNYKESRLTYQLGFTKDNLNFSGISTSGGFGQPLNNSTSFVGFEFSKRVQDITYKSALHIGQNQSNFSQSGMIKGLDDSYYSSFDFGVYKEDLFSGSDSLGIEIFQPLRSEHASMALYIPTGRTKDKNILFEALDIDLTPSGRQINTQLVYRFSHEFLSFYGNLGFAKNQFHQNENKVDPYFQVDIEINLK